MKQADQFLYPKLSSIYNKILQLAAAILLIIILMMMLVSTNNKNSEELSEHFTFIAKQQLQQSIAGLVILLEQEFDDEKQQPFIKLVDQILNITDEVKYPQNQNNQILVKELEEKINFLFYKIYGLTLEDIEIIKRNGVTKNNMVPNTAN